MADASQFIDQIRNDLHTAIENDSVTLPTLPEVALEIREAANDPDVSIAALAAIIEQDGSIAARIVRVGNSSLLRGVEQVSDVKGAISRIGLSYTSTLVTTMAMQQIFLSTKESLNKRMRALWVHSTDVAAICHTLAKAQKGLKPELATLAGVIHQIGALPILSYAVGRGFLRDHPEFLDRALIELTPGVGRLILESWGFADELVIVPEEHLKFDRQPAKADYADLVMVANLHTYAGTSHPMAEVDWSTVTAFERLGLPVDPGEEDSAYAEQIATMQELLRG